MTYKEFIENEAQAILNGIHSELMCEFWHEAEELVEDLGERLAEYDGEVVEWNEECVTVVLCFEDSEAYGTFPIEKAGAVTWILKGAAKIDSVV